MAKHYTLGVYDYDRNKKCELYDSSLDLVGQAYDIQYTVQMNGTHMLTFSIPYMIDKDKIKGSDIASLYGEAVFGASAFGTTPPSWKEIKNYRWDFLKSDYLIRYTEDNKNIWFVANKPQKSKSSKSVVGSVTCDGYETLLKTRNIYKTFDDENGIGNIEYIMTQILSGTGWTYNSATSDILYEKDGTTEKIRSMNSNNKKGAIDLITTACNLFQARPIYDTDTQTITIKAINNRQQVLEGEVGRNLSALTVSHDSSNIATRVYVEGEYGSFGYVGIDDVKVNAYGEPDENGTEWGLPFLLNFDYYREIGAFKETHEAALNTYLNDVRNIKAAIREQGVLLTECENSINELIGQCKLALYYKTSGYITPAYTYGDISDDQAHLNVDDDVVVLNNDGTLNYTKWPSDPTDIMSGAYGVIKFAVKASGKVGAAEVQIEAKHKEIARIERKIGILVPTDPKIPEYQSEIERLEGEIEDIYTGVGDVVGLNEMMHTVMRPDGLLYDLEQVENRIEELNSDQDEIEATFIVAMGYMLRDGYWSNTNYTTGQEVFLYEDARDMTKLMSKPTTNYSFSYVRVTEDFNIPPEDIEINAIFKIYDRELQVDDKLFVKKITYGVDNKQLGLIEVSNEDIALTGNDLGALLSRMSQLADLIDQKNALYDRAKAISESGSIYADRLNGQIDVLKNQIVSSVSNWHTDDQGNIIFVSADGSNAMMLSGAGFMLASGKDDRGDWNWRCMGTGEGITADEIVAGFLSADRIEAGSITTNMLSSTVASELDLVSNTALVAYVQNTAESAAASMKLTNSEFVTMFNNNVKSDIDASIEDVQHNLNEYRGDVEVYMRFDNTGTLELGKSDSDFKTQITNQRMSFIERGNEVAYISNQSMYITQARVTNVLAIGTDNNNGYFDWVVTSTGLGLRWRDHELIPGS